MIQHSAVFDRAARLRRGVNLSHWFSQVYWEPGYTAGHFDAYIRENDLALVADMGFDHVRLPIACEPLLAGATGGMLPRDYLDRILRNIVRLIGHGLAVIIDVHPEDPFKRELAASPATAEAFVDLWRQLAAAIAPLDPERVFLEILNEPCINDAARWNDLQNTTVAAIRAEAPLNTLIISGDKCSPVPELLKLTPPDDGNVIANFHLYDPIAFTHQGASWSPPWAMLTKGLTYPADAAFVAEFMRGITDANALRHLREYVEIGWSAATYHAFVQPAVAWAERHGLPLTCNEFGVYRDFSPRASRLAWLRDVSGALADNGIGWTMWDYSGCFAVAPRDDAGVRAPDVEVVAALGLRPVAVS